MKQEGLFIGKTAYSSMRQMALCLQTASAYTENDG
jgi:hypothetical protein